ESSKTSDTQNNSRPDPDSDPKTHKSRGQGVALAHEAINCLSRIPKNDGLRKRAFQMVTDWINGNQGTETQSVADQPSNLDAEEMPQPDSNNPRLSWSHITTDALRRLESLCAQANRLRKV